jgi:uncharacterized protein
MDALSELDVFLRLNRECEEQLWPATGDELAALVRMAYHAVTIDGGAGMLIAFDERAPYDSPNFLWFKERYPRFAYVDRVAVAAHARGRGIARRLYDTLIAKARADGHTILCAELYSDPPNPQSAAFHSAMGFTEVGRTFVPERGKEISYVVRAL